MVGSVVLFAASLLLVPFIGAEFMPHLDEGALWVRATMPYTISFEESSKISPQVRAILRSFPEVTVVASEHGRPDDGTDPTGFFNDEFFVGLKPYGEWKGPYRTKDQLIEAISKKLAVFPGITFNYTQPAEDAVDEAETGLKSSLAVKIFGPDLAVLEAKGNEIKHVLENVRGIDHVTVVKELGQPSLTVNVDRGKIARYGLNVADVNGLVAAAVGGETATEVVQGEKLFDLVVRLEPPFPADAPRRSGTSWSRLRADSRSPSGSSPTSGWRTARPSSIARTTRATSACSTRWRGGIWRAPWRTPSARSPRG